MNEFLQGTNKKFELRDDGTQYIMNQIWMPKFGDIRSIVLDEAHRLSYFVSLGSNKM